MMRFWQKLLLRLHALPREATVLQAVFQRKGHTWHLEPSSGGNGT